MIAITTKSSINVKPFSLLYNFIIFKNLIFN
jgi:hypothetical protein